MAKWLKKLLPKWNKGTIGGIAEEQRREATGVGRQLSPEEEKIVEHAVKRTVEEYGEALKLMGND